MMKRCPGELQQGQLQGYCLVEILKQKGVMVRIKKTKGILKRPITKLFPTEYACHGANLLVRFNKTREIFPSVTRVLSILLTTAATSASVERVNSKEHVPKIPFPISSSSYAQK